MRNRLHIYDLGVERYVDHLREAEKARLVRLAKKGNKPRFRFLPFLNRSRSSA